MSRGIWAMPSQNEDVESSIQELPEDSAPMPLQCDCKCNQQLCREDIDLMLRGSKTASLEGGSRVTLDSLEKTTGTLEMIAQLYLKKKLNTTQLIERVHVSQQTAYRAIEKLKEFGLILEEVEGIFPKRKNYILSDRGLQLAEAPIYRWNSMLRNWTRIDLPNGRDTTTRGKR